MPLRRLFTAASLAFLVVLAISPAKNALKHYRALQNDFARLGRSRAKTLKAAAEYARPRGIRQIWLPEFDNRVDRCTTCHLGVSDAAMGDAREPFRRHPSTAHTPEDFDRFGCTSCHGGEGPATSRDDAHGESLETGPPMLPAEYLEAGCGRCHDEASVREAPILSRGRMLMERFGCYACHLARSHEAFRSEAPPLDAIAVKTGGEWISRWLKNPRAVDPNATMPNFHLSEPEIRRLANYLFNRPVARDVAAMVTAAGSEPEGDPASGKKIFSESRCITCHTVEGKGNGSAPELSKIASAANRGWLLAFLRDPHAFNPRTRMPMYHFTEGESRDVVAYIEQEFRDFDAGTGLLQPIHVNQTLAAEGEKIFRQRGCFSCHEPTAGGETERFGPDLKGLGGRRASSLDFGRRSDLVRTVPAWLSAKLSAPRSFAAGLKMPSFDFSQEDTRAIVTALLALPADPVPEEFRHEPLPSAPFRAGGPVGKLFDRYRCLSCHRIGADGGDTSTAPLTFEGSKVNRDWLVDYLVLSYTIRPILEERMPVLRMPREEASELADAIEGFFVNPAIPEDPFAGRPAADADPAEGERIYISSGCRGCHILGSSGGYYGPPLSEAGRRLKPGWIYTWLKGPQTWRSDVRCPNYNFADSDALRLTAYLERQKVAPTAAAGGTK